MTKANQTGITPEVRALIAAEAEKYIASEAESAGRCCPRCREKFLEETHLHASKAYEAAAQAFYLRGMLDMAERAAKLAEQPPFTGPHHALVAAETAKAIRALAAELSGEKESG